jgi:hypothetical protein
MDKPLKKRRRKQKWTTEKFVAAVAIHLPDIAIDEHYKMETIDDRVPFVCSHGARTALAWQLLKQKFCCQSGYHAHRNIRMKETRFTIEDRRREIVEIFGDLLDCSDAIFDPDSNERDFLLNIRCLKHNIVFGQWIGSLQKHIGCPACGLEHKQTAAKAQCYAMKRLGKMSFVSKSETNWLNELHVPCRQYWLSDVKYCVDGYDPVTNTVYLYNGNFWHGNPEVFPSSMIHPIRKDITMGELYEKTMIWEQKIRDAGYLLITKWGN